MVGMRNLLTLSVALLMTGPVLAKGKRATAHHDTRLTYVDDEPMSKQAAHANAQSNDDGTLRAIEMRSAGPADVPRAAVGAPEQERGAGSDPMARTVKPVSGALEGAGAVDHVATRRGEAVQQHLDDVVAVAADAQSALE